MNEAMSLATHGRMQDADTIAVVADCSTHGRDCLAGCGSLGKYVTVRPVDLGAIANAITAHRKHSST